MIQKKLFQIYLVFSALLLLWMLLAWFTGSFGDMFADAEEAMEAIFKLLIIAFPPIVLIAFRRKKTVAIQVIGFALLLIKSIYLCYLLFWQLTTLNLATVLITLLTMLVVVQLFTLSKVFSRLTLVRKG